MPPSPITNRARCRGSGPPSSAPAPAPGDIALGRAFPRGDPAVRLAPLARFRRDRRDPRDLARASATIMRKARRFGPGFDLKRGRGGIREIEFFTQIHQLIHGGRDPSLRAPATLDALAALAAAGRLDAPTTPPMLADAYRAAAHDRAPACRWSTTAQTHSLPADPDALDNVARLHGLADGAALLALLAPPRRARRRRSTTRSRRTTEGRLSNDPDIAARASCARSAFATRRRRCGAIERWRRASARSLRSPAAQAAFEAMLPSLIDARSGAAPIRCTRSTASSDIVERLPSGINFFRLLEARPQLAGCSPTILSHAPALADQLARRPELLDGLIDASSFDPPPPVAELAARLRPSAMRGEDYRRRARPRPPAGQRAPVRARRPARRRRMRSARGRRRAMRASPRRAIAASPTPPSREFESVARPGRRAATGHPRPRPARRRGADPRLRPRPHLSVHAAAHDGGIGRPEAARRHRLFQPAGAAASPPRSACRPRPGRSTTSTRGCGRRAAKGMLAVLARQLRRAISASKRLDVGAYGAVPGAAGLRLGARRARALQAMHRRDPRPAARCRRSSSPTRPEMRARHAHATSRPPAPFDIKLGPGGLVDLEFAVHVLQLTPARRPRSAARRRASQRLADAGLVEPGIVDAQRLLTRMLVMLRLVSPDGSEPPADLAAGCRGLRQPRTGKQLLAAHDAARQSIGGAVAAASREMAMIDEGDKAPALTVDRERRRQGRPRGAGPAAGALFLSQGRHLGLHPRGAGFHRAGRRFRKRGRRGDRRVARPDEEPRQVHRQI